MDANPPLVSAPRVRRGRIALGMLLSLGLILLLAEVYLRWFPPEEMHPYLGDASPLTGNLAPDAEFGSGFASLDALIADNPQLLGPDAPLRRVSTSGQSPAPLCLFLGNSFGFNLAARFQTNRPDLRVTTLDRRERLPVRMAQIKTLIKGGIRPDRIFLVITPVDFTHLGESGLDAHRPNQAGGDCLRPHFPPGPLGTLVGESRLAFAAWCRLKLQREHPRFRTRHLARQVPEYMQRDVDRLFAALARVCKEHNQALTVVLVPMRAEVTARSGFVLEDFLLATGAKHGLDMVHPRAAFLAHPRVEELYIADGHLTPLGDDLVLAELERRLAPSRAPLPIRFTSRGAPGEEP